jgi:hypothetical protein
MTTKIFVSQIDTTQPDGTTAPSNSVLLLSETGPVWYEVAGLTGTGYRGSAGYTGSTGYFGSKGYTGSTGEDGALGLPGYRGSVGYQGSGGTNGYNGSVGFLGSAGYFGSTGFRGSVGGEGYKGSVGLDGFRGSAGATGYFGSLGYFGSIGYRGSAGATGTVDPFPLLNLSDVPYDSYNDFAGAYLRVNNERDGITFDTTEVLTTEISSNIEVNGNEIRDPVLKGYSELVNDINNITATLDCSIADGNVIRTTLNAAVVTITMDNAGLIDGRLYSATFFLKQDSTGGRVVDWTNNSMVWSSGDGIDQGTGPVLSTEPNYTDVITLYTLDAGVTWFGVMGAKGFPTSP